MTDNLLVCLLWPTVVGLATIVGVVAVALGAIAGFAWCVVTGKEKLPVGVVKFLDTFGDSCVPYILGVFVCGLILLMSWVAGNDILAKFGYEVCGEAILDRFKGGK